jgi:hypothetical protein
MERLDNLENAFNNPIIQEQMYRLREEGFVIHYWLEDSSTEENTYAAIAIPHDEYLDRLSEMNNALLAQGEPTINYWPPAELEQDERYVSGTDAWEVLTSSVEAATQKEDREMLEEAAKLPQLKRIKPEPSTALTVRRRNVIGTPYVEAALDDPDTAEAVHYYQNDIQHRLKKYGVDEQAYHSPTIAQAEIIIEIQLLELFLTQKGHVNYVDAQLDIEFCKRFSVFQDTWIRFVSGLALQPQLWGRRVASPNYAAAEDAVTVIDNGGLAGS